METKELKLTLFFVVALAAGILFVAAATPPVGAGLGQTTVTVTSSGTRVQFSTTLTNANGVTIDADVNNAGTIYIGTSTVSSTVYVTALTAGQSWQWIAPPNGPKVDLTTIWIDASTNSQKIQAGYWD